jgi:hypothetical protein
MVRIIVTTEQGDLPDAPVLLDEHVCPEHLSDGHSAAQLIERLCWAVTDAEDVERGLYDRITPRAQTNGSLQGGSPRNGRRGGRNGQ